jgi:hypothetical protein
MKTGILQMKVMRNFRRILSKEFNSHIEIVAIVRDNCPAQLSGIGQSLVFFPHLGIHHIPGFNHMVQLVFTHAFSSASAAPILAMANDVTTYLQKPDGMAIMDQHCPTLVKARLVYLVDVLRDIRSYHSIGT